jgi:hypothetical protein
MDTWSKAMPTASQIIKMVTEHEVATQSLRDRFEEDYGLYLLDQRLPPDPDDVEDSNEGYRIYTSNEPMTYADKVISWQANAAISWRVPAHDKQRHEREVDDVAERFLMGAFEAADERLLDMLLPPVQDTASFHSTVRGWIAARALLRKDKEGKTFVDIMPWDVLHTFWGKGTNGLAWACYRTKKTKADIKAEYGKTERFFSGENDETIFDVYDWYDDKVNIVVVEGNRIAKTSTPHSGGESVPVVIVPVPTSPPIVSAQRDDDVKNYGESVFKANRRVYEAHNLIMSVMLELVARARGPSYTVETHEGTKGLEENPWQKTTEIPLRIGERVKAIEALEMTKDVGAFMGIVSGEAQRGSLPHSIFGELQFQLSGFAIKTLRQGIDSVIQPRIKALKNFYRLVSGLLRRQYASGSFENLRVTGVDRQSKFFDEEIEPKMLEQACIPRVSIKSQLPEDDMSVMAFIQMAREGPMGPFLSDEWLRSEKLGLQDADLMDDQIKLQQAKRGLPEAQLWTMMEAAENRGEMQIAQMYYMELVSVELQKFMQRMMLQMPGGAPGTNGAAPGGSAGPTASPQALPEAGFGAPPPAPIPQAGPNMPPGSARPGARTPTG